MTTRFNQPEVKLVCFSAPGGCGKTTIINELMAGGSAAKFTVFSSITRSFYASRGIQNESEFHSLLSPNDKLNFQLDLIAFYMASLAEAVSNCKTKYLICDRAVFDHAAYASYTAINSGLLNPEFVKDLEHICDVFKDTYKPVVITLPYPPHWDIKNNEDGFRKVDFVKDWQLGVLIDHYIGKYYGAHKNVYQYSHIQTVTVQDAVEEVLKMIDPEADWE